ncbi:metalloreductase STEAP4-like isoform X2 [Boleophthalmus pectinirostris]|uniref:metalloreductase STEAP4-like isoform X2 n=1 Tax=Boleophthalmus pectinirostris TaxID=150288 RepID=UPI00242E7E35|nr:metalloreductase STEAP4-like isoform X2 [Boleophthalmus pectinirostris]
MSSDNMNGELKVLNPECLPLAPMGAGGGAAGETLCIFGTGDLGRSLGQRLVQSGYRVTYGSRRPDNCGLIPQGAQVMNHAAAAQSARIIFLCIHREHYSFLQTLAPQLSGKVLVDVSNNPEKDMFPEANAVYLQRLLPEASVVKALNTLSAWGLQNGPSDANRQTFICGDSAEAKQAVSEVCTRLGLWVVDRGGVGASQELEDFPLQLFPEWRLPLSIAVGLSAVFFIYLLIRDIIYSYVEDGKDTSFRIMVSLANKVFPIVSLIMLSLCYLPGVMAALLQLHRGTKYRRFPDWLDRWMLCRKQMGLVALGLASLHVLYTLIIGFRRVRRLWTRPGEVADENAWLQTLHMSKDALDSLSTSISIRFPHTFASSYTCRFPPQKKKKVKTRRHFCVFCSDCHHINIALHKNDSCEL